ncbi:MAG: JAB domain-containing protein [Proteobacteria bacterium]|nr:JAB domain-containing protein [Pseudomonadota bacterium]
MGSLNHFFCPQSRADPKNPQVHPREVFADPITDRASAIIIAHNHPSGGLNPSKEDIEVTKQLKSAGKTLGIKLLDHIIFNHKSYYSFLENGEM